MNGGMRELDRQYNARAAVPDSGAWIDHYATLARRVEAWPGFTQPPAYGVAYGDGADERLDIFPAPQPDSPVMVFIHGGYWRALSRKDGIFMAPLFHRAGATVVSLDYSLAPAATLRDMVVQVRRAVQWLGANIHEYNGAPGRLHVSGHSAGAQLAAMLLVDSAGGVETGQPGIDFLAVPPIESASFFSGLFDLRPLIRTHINDWLCLDEPTARAMSPALHPPRRGCPMVVVCGEAETEAFRWQSRMFAEVWSRHPGVPPPVHLELRDAHHFDCPLSLADDGSPALRAVFGLMGLEAPCVDATGRHGRAST